MTLPDALERVARGIGLSVREAEEVMGAVLLGEAKPTQLAALLMGLRVRGESVDEIVGFARALRRHAVAIPGLGQKLLDTCGTGGDGGGTYNISTAAALVAAGAGVPVAKHGNRSVSSRCGSADVLEALGVRIDVPPSDVPRWLEDADFVFLFAPSYHPAMRHAAPVRRELGIRTAMNLLGPLCNPAGASHQLMGVYDGRWIEPAARMLAALGGERALVVHGADGGDEISISGVTRAAWMEAGEVRTLELSPEDAGVGPHAPGLLKGGDAADNARHLEAALGGEPGALADAIVLNAGASLWVWGAASLAEGTDMARAAIADGRASSCLARLRELSR